MKIHPVVAAFFHADGQKDMTKLIVTFSCFAKTHIMTRPRTQRLVLIIDHKNVSILISSY